MDNVGELIKRTMIELHKEIDFNTKLLLTNSLFIFALYVVVFYILLRG